MKVSRLHQFYEICHELAYLLGLGDHKRHDRIILFDFASLGVSESKRAITNLDSEFILICFVQWLCQRTKSLKLQSQFSVFLFPIEEMTCL